MTTKNTNTENIEEAIVIDDQPSAETELSVIHLAKEPIGVPDTFKVNVLKVDTTLSVDEITKRLEKSRKLVINGCLDKKTIDEVKEEQKFYLKARTGLESKLEDTFKAPLRQFVKAVDKNVEAITSLCKVGESEMKAKITEIEEAIRIEEERKEKEAAAKSQGRVTALTTLGAVFDPEQGIYTFGYDAGLIINSLQLSSFDDEEYNDFIATATQSYNEEQKRLEKEKADAETERQRLLTIEQGVVKARTRELTRMGAALNVDGIFVYQDHDIVPDALKTFTEDEWEELIDKLENPVVVEEVLTEPVAAVIEPVVPKNETPENFGRFTIRPADDLPEDDDIKEQKVQITFTTESPFRVHYFKKSTMLIYSAEFEAETKAGLENVKIVDQGELADTGLMFLLIQKQQ